VGYAATTKDEGNAADGRFSAAIYLYNKVGRNKASFGKINSNMAQPTIPIRNGYTPV
jgi:hypothetical protein